ncbi:MAG: OadG family protein [Prevotella sp.]|nr:OadG family protein [Prevotella sp.]
MHTIRLWLSLVAVSSSMMVFAQGAKNIIISEVQTANESGIEDSYGDRNAWVELENTSYSTYNVRGMFITTNRAVLNKHLSAPERIKLMSVIPSGDDRTGMGARKHLLLFLNTNPAKSLLHLSAPIAQNATQWIALYNANGVELIDSVTVPVLSTDESYARVGNKWTVRKPDVVTPGVGNSIVATQQSKSKIDKFKENDPHGFAMALMAMGIVFMCLALLWLFFMLFGMLMRHIETAKRVAHKQPIKPITKTVEITAEIGHKTSNILQEGLDMKGIDMEVYMSVIGMALRQYEDDVHDVESGIITIKPKDTGWDDEYAQMTQFHNPVTPANPQSQNIPTTPEFI